MTKEDIKKAKAENAERIANISYSGGGHIGQDDLETAFENGAKWRINSVWNDTTEKPKLGELIIVEVYGKIWDYGKYDVCDTIHPKARWAYIKDLIPNTEE